MIRWLPWCWPGERCSAISACFGWFPSIRRGRLKGGSREGQEPDHTQVPCSTHIERALCLLLHVIVLWVYSRPPLPFKFCCSRCRSGAGSRCVCSGVGGSQAH